MPDDLELTGPMAARLWLEVAGCDDVNLFVGVEKWRDGSFVPFEGFYGYGRDRVTTGWHRASLRALDPKLSQPWERCRRARLPSRCGRARSSRSMSRWGHRRRCSAPVNGCGCWSRPLAQPAQSADRSVPRELLCDSGNARCAQRFTNAVTRPLAPRHSTTSSPSRRRPNGDSVISSQVAATYQHFFG